MSRPRRPRQLDAREERIRAYLEGLLDVPVVQHDDGTEDGMYDLTIERPTGSEAVEIVSDASPETRSSMSARKRLPGQIQCPGLRGGWRVRPRNHVTVKGLDARIATALRALEDAGVADMAFAHGPALKAAIDAGLHSAQRDPTLGAGDVRITAAIVTGGSAGLIDEVIDLVTEVLGQSPDVPAKLRASGSQETHAVIAVTADDFRRAMIFSQSSNGLPSGDPSVPASVRHVWLVPDEPDARVLRWSRGSGWIDVGRTPS